MTLPPGAPARRVLEQAYTAFNARDIDTALGTMHPDVVWPNGTDGGTVHGHAAVRDYWTRQWRLIDPRVEPLRFSMDQDGRVVVDVRQVIRDREGRLLKDEMVQHVYRMESDLIREMEIRTSRVKPKSVATAVRLLWASLAIGALKVVLDFEHLRSTAPIAFTALVLAATFGVLSLLVLKISAGRNWARIIFVIMFVIGAIPTASIVREELARAPIVGVLTVLQTGLQLYAMFLLFTGAGKRWFRRADN